MRQVVDPEVRFLEADGRLRPVEFMPAALARERHVPVLWSHRASAKSLAAAVTQVEAEERFAHRRVRWYRRWELAGSRIRWCARV